MGATVHQGPSVLFLSLCWELVDSSCTLYSLVPVVEMRFDISYDSTISSE